MKIPVAPPPQNDFWRGLTPEQLERITTQVVEPSVRGRYRHWDRLRHLTPPSGLSHLEWWFGLKVRRLGGTVLPLEDKEGARFRFNIVDSLSEWLHFVDSLALGAIQQPEPITNPATRDRYLVRSLIEESITSSQLEGASTTRVAAKKMIQEGREPRTRSERMIFNNYRTMQRILEVKEQELNIDLVFEIHRLVTDGTLDNASAAGRFRQSNEKIRVEDALGQVLHIPPPVEELSRRSLEMCNFANGQTPGGFIHPLLRSIILHFWLAYDHPFVDGNGRTARALFYWSMLNRGYCMFEFLTISKVILMAPAKYARAFLYSETDANDLTYFMLYHANVVRRAISELFHYIDRHSKQLDEAEKELQGLTPLNHRQRELIRHALRHRDQRYTVESHRNSHRVVYETARSDLMDLAQRGLLEKKKIGKTWVFTPSADLSERLRRGE